MSLQDRLDAFKANFESGEPPFNVLRDVLETLHRATDQLIAFGQAERAKKVGDIAPSFVLNDARGQAIRSIDLLARGPLALTFYRGVWCPYCNLDLQFLQEALPSIVTRGASLVSISPQSAANSRKAIEQHQLDFPLLRDPRGETSAAFGLRYTFPNYLIDLYKNGFKTDLSAFNLDPSWTLPMPARFVIGTDGVIAYAEISPDYTKRPDPSELLPALDQLASRDVLQQTTG